MVKIEEINEQAIKLFEVTGKRLKEIDNEYAEETQKQYNEMMSGTNCHCGKDGHPLNSMNCPVHGYEIRKKIKMTREEAIKALGQVMSFNRYEFVACLEALGLIKFEEKVITPITLINQILSERTRSSLDGQAIVSWLFDNDYEIVKKD